MQMQKVVGADSERSNERARLSCLPPTLPFTGGSDEEVTPRGLRGRRIAASIASHIIQQSESRRTGYPLTAGTRTIAIIVIFETGGDEGIPRGRAFNARSLRLFREGSTYHHSRCPSEKS